MKARVLSYPINMANVTFLSILPFLVMLVAVEAAVGGKTKDGRAPRHQVSAAGTVAGMQRRSGAITVRHYRSTMDTHHGGHARTPQTHVSFWAAQKMSLPDRKIKDLSKNFSSVKFDIKPAYNGTMYLSDNIDASLLPFSANLHFVTLEGALSVAREDGMVTLGNDTTRTLIAVLPGQIQLLVKFCHLPWHHLHKDLGDTLNLQMSFGKRPVEKSYTIRNAQTGDKHHFQLGRSDASAFIEVVNKVYLAGKWITRRESPVYTVGPGGEHLLSIRTPLKDMQCVRMVMILDPGRDYFRDERPMYHIGDAKGVTPCVVYLIVAVLMSVSLSFHPPVCT